MRAQQNKGSKTPGKYSHIPGWGIDADPDNDPAWPMRVNPTEQHKGYTWERPAQQPADVEVLHSTERPNLSAVFGNTCPPRGLSGIIRRMAFKASENQYRHWLPLVLADKIDVVENILNDWRQLRFFSYFREKGFAALWKYNKKLFLVRIGPALALVTGSIAWLAGKKLNSRAVAGV